MTKITQILGLLFRFLTSCKWKLPERKDILVWDNNSVPLLTEMISLANPRATVFVLETQFKGLYVWPAFLAILMSLWNQRSNFDNYVDVIAHFVRPKAAITFTDNDHRFWYFGGRNRHIHTLVIQNGRRFIYGDVFDRSIDREQTFISSLFCFSEPVGELYAEYCQIEDIYPVGSFKNNAIPISDLASDGGPLLWISSFEPRGMGGPVISVRGEFVAYDPYHATERLAVRMAALAAQSLRLPFEIALRKFSDDPASREEEEWFDEVLEGISFSKSRRTDWSSTYHLIDAARVTITCDGTSGYEAMGRGRKAAFLPYRAASLGAASSSFGWPRRLPKDGPIWTESTSLQEVKCLIERVIDLSPVEYAEVLHAYAPLVMSHDPLNKKLESVLRRIL